MIAGLFNEETDFFIGFAQLLVFVSDPCSHVIQK
jgi:hypothetical protein